MPKKIYIRTFGCQMNVRDSEIILGMLKDRGYTQVASPQEADVILFNTCSVRSHAEERVFGQIAALKKLKKESSKRSIRTTKTIGLLGCMAQNYQEEIFQRFPNVGLVCGPANIYDIPDLLEKVSKERGQILAVERLQRPLIKDCGFRLNKLKAFVSIMYGCDNFCSYCIVPYVRGRERSRPLKHIVDEAKGLAEKGCKEITLLGQNVNSYGRDLKGRIDFVGLLERLDKIKGIERIRFVTSHPKDASKKLFQAMRRLPKVCEHLHLPLQAGSDTILRSMNRGYTLGDYLELIDQLRSLIADCSLSSDIIVGFPGETKHDFQKTIYALQKIQFDEAFIFKYSPRVKTKAAELEDDVPQEEKQRRNQVLLALQEQISLKKNKALLSKPVEVLVEGEGRHFTGKAMLKGRSRSNKVTLFAGRKNLLAQLVNVQIKTVSAHTLIGEIDGKKS